MSQLKSYQRDGYLYLYILICEVEQGKARQDHESIKYKDQISLDYTSVSTA